MSDTWIVVAVAGAYLALSLIVGILPGRKASGSAAGFVAGDRGLGLVVMYFITGATIFSAYAFLGTPGWAYSKGVAACYTLAYGALGFIPFYFVGPRAARVGRRYGFVTQAQMVAHRFQRPALAGLMALVSLTAFVPYLALQMKGAGYVIESMTDGRVSAELGAAIVYGVVVVYVMWSGVLGVGWTNTLQGVFMMVLAWALGLYVPYALYGGIGPMFERITAERPELLIAPGLNSAGGAWTWAEYTSAFVTSAIGFSFWPHLFMKAFSARDDATLRRTVVLYPTFQLFIVPILLIGFAGVLFATAPAKPDQILPHLITQMDLSPFVVGLFCAGALAASMSSGDAMAHATASILVRDGWVTACQRELSARGERTLIRIVLVGVVIASYLFAVVWEESLVDLLLYAYDPVVQFAPVVLATLYLRRATGGIVLAALTTGIVVTVIFLTQPDWRPWPLRAGMYGLVANTAVLLVGVALRREADEGGTEFLDVAACATYGVSHSPPTSRSMSSATPLRRSEVGGE